MGVIKPVSGQLMVKKPEVEVTTTSGIILTGKSNEPQWREVVAVGEDCNPDINIGSKVILRQFYGTDVKVDGVDYLIIENDKVEAILED